MLHLMWRQQAPATGAHVLMLVFGLMACRYWLHPQRFKTEMCQFGGKCSRSVCFYAHSMPELRVRVLDSMSLIIHSSCNSFHASAVLTCLHRSA